MIYKRKLPTAKPGIPKYVAGLRCDSCECVLFTPSMLTGFLDLGPLDEPLDVHRAALRALAQQNGWAFILVSVQSNAPRDLCPDCFELPPEG